VVARACMFTDRMVASQSDEGDIHRKARSSRPWREWQADLEFMPAKVTVAATVARSAAAKAALGRSVTSSEPLWKMPSSLRAIRRKVPGALCFCSPPCASPIAPLSHHLSHCEWAGRLTIRGCDPAPHGACRSKVASSAARHGKRREEREIGRRERAQRASGAAGTC